MKLRIYILSMLMMILMVNTACEEEEAATYEIIGESTDTITDLTLSNDEPVAGEEITITAYYVNISEDPASKIDMYVKVGDGERTMITSLDEASAAEDAEITRTLTYEVPADLASETEIIIDMELFTQRQFPKVTRTTLEVAE